MSENKFKPVMGLWDGTMIVVGSMIGSGVFIVGADILRNVGSAGWLVGVWLITGFMTITAAVSYGELSGMFPKAGGQYVYLKESYNPLVGFLYGWSFFMIIQTGTIAAVGVAFSKFLAYLVPAASEDIILLSLGSINISPAQVISIVLIIFLTYVNTRGVEGGKSIQSVFTVTKIASLFGLIVFGFIMMDKNVWDANWTNAWDMHKLNADGTFETYMTIGAFGAIASAMVGSIFSSDAWNSVTFIGGEMKNPQRNIGLSLFLGTFIVTIIYVSANLMYTAVLPLGEIAFADKDRVAVAASNVIFGNAGTIVIALMIMVSTFGCNNGLILAGARVCYTMAKDGLFFKQAGQLNKFGVPQYALWVQCALSCFWCLSGKYGDLLDMVSFVVVLFYILTIIGIFILRKKRPEAERPYKAFGYPFLPAIYIAMGTMFCTLLIIYKPKFTWPGLIIALIGIPVYYLVMSQKKEAKG
ncbi:MAG: amino acid permease [Cyclobacteriaceae bacterium]|nr:amino acid permease [Cyclobacteriaceae bacterium]